ncbi:MAG TPA: HAD hydrolase family protein, partial [Chloroflexota bacterium]|nr:HAD hydrolase family protein [Chloroflexota bacterium]
AVAEQGVTIVIATGRRWRTAMDVIEPLGVGDYLIQSSGAVVRRVATAEILLERFIPGAIARPVVELGRAHGITGVWYDVPGRTRKIYVFGSLHEVESLQRYASRNLAAFVETDGFEGLADAMELVFFGEEDRLREFQVELESRYAGKVWTMPWTNYAFASLVLEVVGHEVSKGAALEWLAGRLGVTRGRVLAIGDDVNDMEMIEWAGRGIAMGNASQPVLDVADEIIGSVEDRGLAKYLGRMF